MATMLKTGMATKSTKVTKEKGKLGCKADEWVFVVIGHASRGSANSPAE